MANRHLRHGKRRINHGRQFVASPLPGLSLAIRDSSSPPLEFPMKMNWIVFALILFFAGCTSVQTPPATDDNADSIKANPIVQEAIRYLRERNGQEPSVEEIANVLNRTTVHYLEKANYAEAERFARRALAFGRQQLGAEHRQTLASLHNLAALYDAQGRYGEAEPLYRRTLETQEKVLGLEHPHTLSSLNNLAMLYQAQGRYGEAEPLYERVLETSEKVLGPEHPQTLVSLNNLAWLYEIQGRHGEAEPLFQRALAGSEKTLGESHPDALSRQLNFIILEISRGNIEGALMGLRAMDGRLRRFVDAQLDTSLDEKTRRGWLGRKSNFQAVVYNLALQHPSMETRRFASDVLLGWRHLGGEGEALDARLVATSEDPAVGQVVEELAASRSRLSHLMNSREPDPVAIKQGQARLGKREVQLAALSREYRGHLDARQVTWQAVQEKLPLGAALLALRRFLPLDFKTGKWGEAHWLGMLLPARAGAEPRLADLGAVAEISTAVARSRTKGAKAWARQFYASLFGRWDQELAKYDSLYLVPDGALELMPFERFILPDGRYWV